MTAGSIRPGSVFCVCALNALQNSMMFSPRCPSAGPIGGDGLALPAGTCSLMNPTTFFAISNPSLEPKGARYGYGEPPARVNLGRQTFLDFLDLRILQLDGRRAAE